MLSFVIWFFFQIPASAADAIGANLSGKKTFVVNRWSTIFIIGKPVFNGPKRLPRNRSEFINLDSWVFDKFILFNRLFGKSLWNFETCLSIASNWWEKSVSLLELPVIFGDIFRIDLVAFYNIFICF